MKKSIFEVIYNKSFDEIKNIVTKEPYFFKTDETEDLFLLKYDQIKTDMNYLASRQSRGIIFEKQTNKLVCYPFDKFFNYGELLADKIDFKKASILEKVDGSIIKVFYYKKWCVATNGKIDAFTTILQNDTIFKNFGELFIEAMSKVNLNLFDNLNKNNTYLFELTSPYNRVVVPYKDIKITHTGTRNNITLKEIEEDIGVEKPKKYFFNSFDDILKNVEKLPYNKEGYVLLENYKRVKVKSLAYVAVHHLHNNGTISKKRVLDLIKSNEHIEYLSYFPEDKKTFDLIEKKYIDFKKKLIISEFEMKSFIDLSRKDFAMWAIKQENSEYLFKKLDNPDLTIDVFLNSKTSDKVLTMMGVK